MMRNILKKYSRAAGDLSQVKNVEAIRKTEGEERRLGGVFDDPKILT
jgi:hypothetical protein